MTVSDDKLPYLAMPGHVTPSYDLVTWPLMKVGFVFVFKSTSHFVLPLFGTAGGLSRQYLHRFSNTIEVYENIPTLYIILLFWIPWFWRRHFAPFLHDRVHLLHLSNYKAHSYGQWRVYMNRSLFMPQSQINAILHDKFRLWIRPVHK